jgi:hypothetical protein
MFYLYFTVVSVLLFVKVLICHTNIFFFLPSLCVRERYLEFCETCKIEVDAASLMRLNDGVNCGMMLYLRWSEFKECVLKR